MISVPYIYHSMKSIGALVTILIACTMRNAFHIIYYGNMVPNDKITILVECKMKINISCGVLTDTS
jgi:hypothetical protein